MQNMLYEAYLYACNWRYEYNAEKSAIVIIGADSETDVPLKLGDQTINVYKSLEHVGTLVADRQVEIIDYIKKRIDACRKPCNAIMGIGSIRAPMIPKSASKLYWTNCVSKLTYGLQLMDLPKKAINMLQSFHAGAAKLIQGLPDQASNDGALHCMGWMPMDGYIEMLKLNYFVHLLLLPIDCIYKKILIKRYCLHMYCKERKHIGPTWDFICLSKKYGLLDLVKDVLENNKVISMDAWKKTVKQKIWNIQNQKLSIICTLNKTLYLFSTPIESNSMLAWWHFVQLKPSALFKCRIIMRLLLDCHNLKSCMVRHKGNEISNDLCEQCSLGTAENIQHILFECTRNDVQRKKLWFSVLNACPKALANDIERMDVKQKTAFLLTGLGNNFVKEWMYIYDQILDFVYSLYIDRIKLKNVM